MYPDQTNTLRYIHIEYEPGKEIALGVGSANVLTRTFPHIVQFVKDVQLVQITALLPGWKDQDLSWKRLFNPPGLGSKAFYRILGRYQEQSSP